MPLRARRRGRELRRLAEKSLVVASAVTLSVGLGAWLVEVARAEALIVDGWRWSLAGLGGGLVLAVVAGWSFIRRDVR